MNVGAKNAGDGRGTNLGGKYLWVGLDRLHISNVHPRLNVPTDVTGEVVEGEPRAVSVVRAYRDRLTAGHEMVPAEVLRVRPSPGQPGHYEVFDGALRFRALKMAGCGQALVAVESLSDDEVYRAMLRSDNRADLSPLELGFLIRAATTKGSKLGLSRAVCAREIGKSDEYVRQLCVAAEVAEAQNQVSLILLHEKAQHLAAIHDEAPPEMRHLLVEQVVEEGLTAKQTRSRARQASCGGEDVGPEPVPRKTLTRAGEVVILGDHRLLCGDATVAADVWQLMSGKKAAAMWTDPPYGVSYVGKTKAAMRLRNDSPDRAPELIADALVAAEAEALAGGSPYYIAHPAGPLAIDFGLALRSAGWCIHQTLVWAKNHFVRGHSDHHYRHEPIYYGYSPGGSGAGRFGPGRTGWHGGDDQDSLFEVARPKASPEHPTTKPVQLIEANLLNSTQRGDRVYDPFCGSGSMLIACERLGRRALVMEIEPKYCDVICARYQRETGVMPVVEATGEKRDYLAETLEETA